MKQPISTALAVVLFPLSARPRLCLVLKGNDGTTKAGPVVETRLRYAIRLNSFDGKEGYYGTALNEA